MKKEISLLVFSILILTFSCSSDDDSNDGGDTINPIKLIQSLSFDDETNVDSLFYDNNNRLILKKEYLDVGQLDYDTHYEYDSANNLIRTYRIHSTSVTPSGEVNYTYDTNGNLLSRVYSTFGSTQEYLFEYEANVIIVNRNQEDEVRINLSSGNRIQSVERKNASNQFFVYKEYIYDGNNITEVRINEGSEVISFVFEFDNNNFPFSVFDFDLPNGLSIKRIEEAILFSNYPFITIGDGDNYFGFLNENNVISCSGSGSSNYSYSYDSEGYPVQITYDFLFIPSSLIVTYY
ncbi:hypothetical protein [Winogradskyella sp.]|uniref:hypothetical protein n=1 Tax=Winogradskyella sp. TaxID=1883156 RepID=UPI0026126426|nr:hypothetical protein [Winogradskyella sp.]